MERTLKAIRNKNLSNISILIGAERRYSGKKLLRNVKSTGTIRNPNPTGAPAGQNPIMYIPVDQGTKGSTIPSDKRYIPGDYEPPNYNKTNSVPVKPHDPYFKPEKKPQQNFYDRDGVVGGDYTGINTAAASNLSDMYVGTENLPTEEQVQNIPEMKMTEPIERLKETQDVPVKVIPRQNLKNSNVFNTPKQYVNTPKQYVNQQLSLSNTGEQYNTNQTTARKLPGSLVDRMRNLHSQNVELNNLIEQYSSANQQNILNVRRPNVQLANIRPENLNNQY